MVPELKFKCAFPGFGSIELVGEFSAAKNNFHQVTIKFIPSESCEEKMGLLIKLTRTGNCFVHELKPLSEEDFEVTGVA
jgi:hypothetical protein